MPGVGSPCLALLCGVWVHSLSGMGLEPREVGNSVRGFPVKRGESLCTRLHKIHGCVKRPLERTKSEEPLAGAGDFLQSSRVRHGFGVREVVPLAVGSLSYRRVILPPCGVRGLCGAVARCFGYAEIAIEFSNIDV